MGRRSPAALYLVEARTISSVEKTRSCQFEVSPFIRATSWSAVAIPMSWVGIEMVVRGGMV